VSDCRENKLSIALIGTRGVPASYGGFETCVEEIGHRLADKGHLVTVYCRKSHFSERQDKYRGMRLVYLPSLKKKSLETLSHSLLSIFHALSQEYDVYMVFNAANSPVLVFPRLLGKKIAINTDGLEWKRGKWGAVGKRYYKFSEWLSGKCANRIVADSRGIKDYYLKYYNYESTYIAYGADPQESSDPELLNSLGIEPGEYFLQITRFEPENNPLLTVQAFQQLSTAKKLVLVGGVPYESNYSRLIRNTAGEKVVLTGPIYEKALLAELWCNCYAYIHGNEVGGTNPALLQTMANGCYTIAIDVPFSRDVLADCGCYFKKDADDLSTKMRWALEHPEELAGFKQMAQKRVREEYSWEQVTSHYEKLFNDLRCGKYG